MKNLFRIGVSGLLSAVVFPGCFVLTGESFLNGFFDGNNGDTLLGDGSVCEGSELIVAGQAWQGYNFTADNVLTSCTGARFVRFDEQYGLYVGVSLCTADQYKIFLGESLDSTFHQIGDWAGGGQDHCELVNPSFTIPNEDDITSGCPDCSISDFQMWDEAPLGTTGYVRGYFGEPFELTTNWEGSQHTAEWYQCGVSFDAECGGGVIGGDGVCGAPEVNVVGIYEPNGAQSGAFSLHVDRPGPQILVLTSYTSVDWNITAAPEAQILQIIASGYETTTVNGPAGVPVDITGWLGACAYEYPDQDLTSGCETPDLFDAVQNYVGAEVTSFNGCYQMGAMTLNADLSATGSCSVDQGYSLTGYVDADCSNPTDPTDPTDPGTGGCGGEEHFCGDGIVDAGEECDDANNVDGDGCSAICLIEAGCGDPTNPDK